MTEINTLSQFLTTANTQFQVYDLGRRVQHIDMLAFNQIELLTSPYPFPIQGHAQFAVVFWQQQKQPYIWFIKLILDEQGCIAPAPRSQFMQMIVEALGRDPTQTLSEAQQEQLANHPFSFKPTQQKLAIFNALVRKQLGQQASSQFEYAASYLSGQIKSDAWQQVGFQGIADVCVRSHTLNLTTDINKSLMNAPIEVQAAICQCLEHIDIQTSTADILVEQLQQAENDKKLIFLSALGSSSRHSILAFNHLLESSLMTAETLITFAARNWQALQDDSTRKRYLEALAEQPQSFFNQVFADIVAIPSLRHLLLSELRNPDRSAQLSTAIGGLFKAANI